MFGKKKKDDWYRRGLYNLLASIEPTERSSNRVMAKLESLIQLLAQKEDESN